MKSSTELDQEIKMLAECIRLQGKRITHNHTRINELETQLRELRQRHDDHTEGTK